jgi:hypothetical protein
MMRVRSLAVLTALTTFVSLQAAVLAQSSSAGRSNSRSKVIAPSASDEPTSLRLAYADPKKQEAVAEKTTMRTTEHHDSGYRGVSAFFNVREANANVDQGEWEFEVPAFWTTDTEGGDDDFRMGTTIKYGISQGTYVELALVPINIGDGGDMGAGDLELELFHTCIQETDSRPAFGAWLEGRFPSGDGSTGVDGTLGMSVTKSFNDKLRGHMAGFLETANGAPGGEDEEGRRDFQWGAGIGVDYRCSDKTLGLINYFNRANDRNGSPNQNILEIGVDHELCPGQHLKAAIDIGLDGNESTPDFGAKLQWGIEF